MRFIIDTNVLISALLHDGIVRDTLLSSTGCFITPESCIREVWEHRRDWGGGGQTEVSLKEEVELLCQTIVTVLPEEYYSKRIREARLLIDDPDDVPVVALALAVRNEGIWTFNTKDFSKPALLDKIRVLKTSEIRELMDFKEPAVR